MIVLSFLLKSIKSSLNPSLENSIKYSFLLLLFHLTLLLFSFKLSKTLSPTFLLLHLHSPKIISLSPNPTISISSLLFHHLPSFFIGNGISKLLSSVSLDKSSYILDTQRLNSFLTFSKGYDKFSISK